MSDARLVVPPIELTFSLKSKIYEALKDSIASMNIYSDAEELRLDERQLSDILGVSRTPIREAIARLEQEGLVRIVPRRGVFVARKTKGEILDMITVWAALEGMAARLITQRASDADIATLRQMFVTIDDNEVRANIDEYAETNIHFHQALLAMSQCNLLTELTENLFIHMRSIRKRTIAENDRASRSIIDHMHIIEALEARDTDTAERLARDHTLNLGRHIEENVHWLD